MGAVWGLTQPLSKIAVSTGYRHFGLISWQLIYMIVVLGGMNLIRGKGLPFQKAHLICYALIAILGTVIPNAISYQAAIHLPAGILSILMTLVAMFSLPLALAARLERFDPWRMFGVLCGAAAIVLLAGPEASLPDPAMAIWVLIAAIAPFMYAMENTYVARYGTLDLDAVQVLLGASVVGLVITLPLTFATGQWINMAVVWGAPEAALLVSSVLHAVAYAGYIWLIGRTGSVFASLVAYLTTGCGILWAMVLLDESYSGWVWSALALMMIGLFMVRPKEQAS